MVQEQDTTKFGAISARPRSMHVRRDDARRGFKRIRTAGEVARRYVAIAHRPCTPKEEIWT